MTKCYHTCLCGKVHRFNKKNLGKEYFKCPVPVWREVEGGGFRRKKKKQVICDKPVAHLFYINNAYHASCEKHWTGKLDLYGGPGVELETLE